jgi:hypothetical protein
LGHLGLAVDHRFHRPVPPARHIGWAKAGWVAVVLLLPYICVLIYLIAQGRQMANRRRQQAEAAQSDDAYVRSAARAEQPADQIEKTNKLLNAAAITHDEYEVLKRKALTQDTGGH